MFLPPSDHLQQVVFGYLIPPLLGLGASLILTGAVRAYAVRTAMLDVPNDRSSHSAPTPRGGGLGLVTASCLGLTAAWLMKVTDLRLIAALGGGMAGLALIGWLDDRKGVSARLRFAIHVLVAAIAAYMLGGLDELRVGGRVVPLGPTGYLIAIVGIVWSINLFNFMDGIDGLAGSQAVLIFGIASGFFFYLGEIPLAVVSAVIAAASAGFLAYNWPPAKIFMGDVGSGPLGFLVAAVALASEAKQSVPLLVFAILGGVFVFDATVTLIRRVLRRRRISEAHRDHAYQRLTRICGNHRPVTLAAAVVTIVMGLFSVFAVVDARFAAPAAIATTLVLGGLMVLVERRSPM